MNVDSCQVVLCFQCLPPRRRSGERKQDLHAPSRDNSCRNRHCPKYQAQARQRGIEALEREALSTTYFHVVFSVPHKLSLFALENPRAFYDLLFTVSAATALEIAADPKHLGAEIGIIRGL
jgi:hypothetical protein